MTLDSPREPTLEQPAKRLSIKVFGIGSAGVKVMEQLIDRAPSGVSFVALNTDGQSLAGSSAAEKLHLDSKLLRGLGTGADPERGRALAEEHSAQLKALCQGVDATVIVAGLGGGAGTGISPVLARIAKEAGALVLGFVLTPFECEGSRRQRLAQYGLEELKAAADGVVCLPNQAVFKLIDENTSVIEAFKITNEYLAEGVRGFWRLLTHKGLIEIHFADLCDLIRDRHAESTFAVAEAMGATRSREVTDKLLAHPMLDDGRVLEEASTVLVSLQGGPDLTMAEVQRVMQALGQHCQEAQVIMGAAIQEEFRERLAVTMIATRKEVEATELANRSSGRAESLDTQLLSRTDTPRRGSRFVPPPPALSQEKRELLLARQGNGASRARKSPLKMRQTQLPLDIVSKGRFDKSEPTIHKGEDLDVPTYIRRGVSLN